VKNTVTIIKKEKILIFSGKRELLIRKMLSGVCFKNKKLKLVGTQWETDFG